MAGLILGLAVALLFTLVFFVGFRRRGPWESLWAFFIVVFVASMAIGAWVRPVGPVAWGVAWVPLVVGALFVALLVAASTPVAREPREAEPRAGADRSAMTFFWVLLLGFLVVWGSAWMV